MYNEDRKRKFMAAAGITDVSDAWVLATFRNVQPMEERLSKDLAEFTANEVGQAFADVRVSAAVTIGNKIPLVVRYKNWCAEQGFKSVLVRSEEISVDVTDMLRETMVYSPSQLDALLKEAFPDVIPKSSACVYRAFIWLGFAGMNAEDAADVRVSDVNFKHRIVTYSGRMYEIPLEGIPDIRAVCKAKEFVRASRVGGTTVFERADGDRILRGRKIRKEISLHGYVRETLRPMIQQGFKRIGHGGMSFNRVRKSGIFYGMFEREGYGFPVNFAQVAMDDYQDGGYKESKGNPKQKIIRRIMLNYERDYAAWKHAFEQELLEEFRQRELKKYKDGQ